MRCYYTGVERADAYMEDVEDSPELHVEHCCMGCRSGRMTEKILDFCIDSYRALRS